MKRKNILCAAGALALLLASCGGGSDKSARTLADYDNVTAADSLIYYFGQLRAMDYWQYSYNDSTLKTRESRDEYLKGLRAGMDAARDNDAYNMGLSTGIQLAMNLKEFSEGYDVEFNRAILLNAIEDGLVNDSVVNAGEANQEFRKVLEQLNLKKEEADRKIAGESLAESAKAAKWTRISDNLYATAGKGGEGATLKTGQEISIKIEISNLDGKEIDRRALDSMKVGQAFPGPIAEVLLTMKMGEERTFYTTGPALFGRFIDRYGVKPTQVLVVKIATAAPKAKEAPAESAE